MNKLEIKPGKNTREVSALFTLETDSSLIEKQNKGKRKHKCKLCGKTGNYQTWAVTEMYFGLGGDFEYFECPNCQTLQIKEFPEDLARYYPRNYYSFAPPSIEPVRMGAMRDERAILDVGCGSGGWLCFLASIGCVNLTGCDPFLEKDITYSNGVKVKKCTVHEIEGSFDVIHAHNTFEHLPDPEETFKTFERLLKKETEPGKENPKIELNMPLYPSAAFEVYGPFWYQIDAPRHLFIHSLNSIKMLAEKNSLVIKSVRYRDDSDQFIISRMYQKEIPFIRWRQCFTYDGAFESLRENHESLEALGKCAAMAGVSDEALITLERE